MIYNIHLYFYNILNIKLDIIFRANVLFFRSKIDFMEYLYLINLIKK